MPEITRTYFPKQRDFARFVLRKQWNAVFRVRLNETERNRVTTKEFHEWVDDHLHGRWSKSDANEVFYFEEISDATMFRLRWSGAVSDAA